MRAPVVDPASLEQILRDRFGHDAFREGQLEAIQATLAGRHVVAVMPTGGGKSLLYQLPAVMLPGVSLVVSPLIALMKDQVDQLNQRGLAATYINSTLSTREQDARLAAAARGEIRLLYIAPERFRNDRFRSAVGELHVAMLAIDEAHCISQWGHDFRPDYRRLGEARELVGREVPVVALTATATPEVRRDIVAELGLDSPLALVTGFERKNLFISVVRTARDAAKRLEIERTIEESGGSGIIYVASRKSGERVLGWIESMRHRVGLYHAGLRDDARSRVQDGFMSGELPIIVATNAFGMGIDKSDTRFVVHNEFPKSLEAYYQEIGRAGRDGLPARATLLFSPADKRIQEFFIEGANPSLALVHAVYADIVESASDPELVEAEIARRLGLRNDMAVTSAVSLLARTGVVKRVGGTPNGQRRRIELVETMPPHELPIDGEALARKLATDRTKLEQVLRFGFRNSCRKEQILAYFGDRRRRPKCGSCDVCAPRPKVGKTVRTKPAVDVAVTPKPPRDDLTTALKSWRRDEARRRAVPAHLVFDDNTLEAIVAARPSSERQLADDAGFSARKMEAYGREVLRVVRDHR